MTQYDIGTHEVDARDAEAFLETGGAGRVGRLPRRVLLTVTRATPDAERVSAVHARVSDMPGVPRVFFAGPISGKRFAIVTSVLRGRAPDASPEDYVLVEKTVCSLWLAGVAHGALTPGWFVVADGVATVRDLGHAIELPKSSARPAQPADVADAVARANAAVRLATLETQTPDGDFLRDMYSRVPREDRPRIVDLREAAWAPSPKSSAGSRQGEAGSRQGEAGSRQGEAGSRQGGSSSSSADLSGLTSLFMSPIV